MIKKPLRERSALVYVLVALIPYSKPNLLLAYKPSQFYWELEKISRYKESSLRNAFRRGVKDGFITSDASNPKLTELGKRRVVPFVATCLGSDAELLVAFDVPEEHWRKRQTLRNMLKRWNFHQVQKSVWSSQYDFREALAELTEELELKDCVAVYEAVRLLPK